MPGMPTPPGPASTTPPLASDQADSAPAVEGKVAEGMAQGEVAAEQSDPVELLPEQERIAILRMIAEGRITPEEGDMLLEALG